MWLRIREGPIEIKSKKKEVPRILTGRGEFLGRRRSPVPPLMNKSQKRINLGIPEKKTRIRERVTGRAPGEVRKPHKSC